MDVVLNFSRVIRTIQLNFWKLPFDRCHEDAPEILINKTLMKHNKLLKAHTQK